MAGTYVNTIPANSVTSSQGSNTQAAQATLTVVALAPVAASKAFSPTNVHGNGNASRLTITLPNSNGVPLTNVAITDTLPAQLAISPTPNAATTCSLGNRVEHGNVGQPERRDDSCEQQLHRFRSTSSRPGSQHALQRQCHQFRRRQYVDVGAQGVTNARRSPTPSVGSNSRFARQGVCACHHHERRHFDAYDYRQQFQRKRVARRFDGSASGGHDDYGTRQHHVRRQHGRFYGDLGCDRWRHSEIGVAVSAGVTNTSCTITTTVTATNVTTNAVTLTNNLVAGMFSNGVKYAAASGALVVNPVSPITGSKTFTGGAVQTGVLTMTITLNNTTATAATITAFTDNLRTTMGASPNFTVASSPAASTTCVGGTVTAVAGTTAITMNSGVIPANGSCTIVVPDQVGPTAPTGNRTNTIAANAVKTTQGNNVLPITGVVNIGAALTVAKAFAPATVFAGQNTVLTVTVTRAA